MIEKEIMAKIRLNNVIILSLPSIEKTNKKERMQNIKLFLRIFNNIFLYVLQRVVNNHICSKLISL
tara:strand:- start:154 stop:351 length:198 start_codon:yes stop_codon:yes gene_type:complete